MDYTCANCKNRFTWECEDYHWGYLDSRRCRDDFVLDVETLPKEAQDILANLAMVLGEVER